jgi:hypothetical protein
MSDFHGERRASAGTFLPEKKHNFFFLKGKNLFFMVLNVMVKIVSCG